MYWNWFDKKINEFFLFIRLNTFIGRNKVHKNYLFHLYSLYHSYFYYYFFFFLFLSSLFILSFFFFFFFSPNLNLNHF